jgi:polyhydroxyalkanoate synthase
MEEFSRNMLKIAARSQRLVSDFLERQAASGAQGPADPLNIGGAFLEMTAKMMQDPAKLIEAQASLWQEYLGLWQSTARRMAGEEAEPAIRPEKGDRRFKHPDWDDNQIFDFIKQSYLLTSRWLRTTVGAVEGLDDKSARKVDFHTRQFVDAMAPTNFVLTNPEVLRATLDSKGENLVKGLDNLLGDLERGKGRLSISMTDRDAFEVGGNVAVSPGKVVFQTELMQLIQYAPATETVYKRPLLIAPPWINKFYILDLKPQNSFIKWAVEKGYTVFVISWVNPDESLSHKSFEDYMREGILAALDAIEQATGEREVNAIGYCLGGTLMAATLAYMKAVGDERIKAVTFFASLVDFAEAGELEVFIDDEQIGQLEERMAEKGYLDGAEMATTFNMLRANDLIWSFVINNYLLGKDPFPFDLLYWNSDSTRMPAVMHSFYLRKMYQENRLSEPGGIELGGVPIDLGAIDIPVYILAAKDDHIAPWISAFVATRLYSGAVKFVLAASGHIAGVINPPAAKKYGYWTNAKKAETPEAWLDTAERHEGSWWPDWHRWLGRKSGKKVPARTPGEGKLKPLEDAPGAYVKVRAS